jgi:hypothetical protein
MNTLTSPDLSRVSDRELMAGLARLCGRDRETTALILAHLGEVEARQLHFQEGFSSMFAYCREVLKLSENEAYNRIDVARLARQYPAILDAITGGSLTITTARLLSPHLTTANHGELLAEAAGKSKHEVEELVAARFPREDVPPSVRKLPERRGAASAPAMVPGSDEIANDGSLLVAPPPEEPQAPAPSDAPPSIGPRAVTAVGAAPTPRHRAVTPVAAERYVFRFTGGTGTRDKLRKAQDLLRHAVPSGDPAEIFDRALTALLEQLAKKKFAAATHPKASAPPATEPRSGREIPAAVRRAVWERDGGACAFIGNTGRRCAATAWVEYHHVTPYAAGGQTTVENLQLRCRAHNGYEADVFYGREKRKVMIGRRRGAQAQAKAQAKAQVTTAGP